MMQVVYCSDKEFINTAYECPIEAAKAAAEQCEKFKDTSWFYVKRVQVYGKLSS
jgi:hypothetical protein